MSGLVEDSNRLWDMTRIFYIFIITIAKLNYKQKVTETRVYSKLVYT